jgi:septum site-determining protein MinC
MTSADPLSVAAAPPPPAAAGPRPAATLHLRGGAFTMLVLRLTDPKDAGMFAAIADKVSQAPNFFRGAPVVADLAEMREKPLFNIAELGRRLRQHQLMLVGVQNGNDEQNRAAVNAGLCLFPEGRKAALEPPPAGSSRPVPADQAPVVSSIAAAVPAAAGSAAPGKAARVLSHGVRSGQQIYTPGDLVVMGSVSPGAELLADGHIHVYGSLRGRALAGVSGDPAARIFCRSLDAELVSVAGVWRVRDNIADDVIGRPAQVSLTGDALMIEPMA